MPNQENLLDELDMLRQQVASLQTERTINLNRFFDLSLDLLCVIGFDSYFKHVNTPWLDLLGYTKADLKAKPVFARIHPDDEKASKEAMREVLLGKKLVGFVNRYRCVDGSYKWLSWNITPLPDEELIYAVVRDITDHKRMEEELRENENRYRQMFEKHSSIRWLVDPVSEEIVQANEAAANFYGYSLAQLTDMNLSQINALSTEEIATEIEQAKIEQRNYLIVPHRLASGEIRYMEIHSHPIEIRGETLLYSIMHDITQRKLMEAELIEHREHLGKLVIDRTRRLELVTNISGQMNEIRDLQQLLNLLVNQLRAEFGYYHVHVYLVEPKTNDLIMIEGSGEVGQQLKAKGHHLTAGQGIVGTVASSNQHFVSNNVKATPHFFRNPLLPDTNSELAVPLRKYKQTEEATDEVQVLGVLDIQDKQPNRFTKADIMLIQSIADQTAIAIDNVRLLTEREATIAQLKEFDRAKSQFITMISHELRTPLNAINGFSELLLMGLSGDLPPQAQEDVELIHNSGQNLLTLIDDILDVAKIQSGQVKLTPQTVNVHHLFDEIAEITNKLINDKQVEILIDVPDNIPQVYVDYVRLKQVLEHLVTNAIKFTHDGYVTIKANWADEADRIKLAVIDTGIGIPADKQRLIFEHFQQVDMTDAREYGGAGLGLTICQHLVEMHGGMINVRSEVGVGSEFFFTVPISKNKI